MTATDVFVLLGGSKIWGLFSDKALLYSMYENLTRAAPTLELKIQQIKMDTNILVKEWDNESDIRSEHHPCDLPGSKKVDQEVIPTELKLELVKLKTRLSEFTQNMKVFRKMLDDGVLSLDSSLSDVPKLFRDKYYVFRDIVKFNVPDDDAFGYFTDRYYYKPLVDIDDD